MEITLQIQNQAGLHARPAATLAQTAAKFSSNITLLKDSKQGNAKSIISVMGLGVRCGDVIVAKIDGADAAEAAAALQKLVNDKFGEV